MIKFNEWLENKKQQLNEAGPARLRTRYQAPSELSNVGIGRIGPLGTFGQTTGQGDIERGIGGVMGALGQAVQRDLVKPTAISRLEAPLILKRLAEGVPLEIFMKLPLQLPITDVADESQIGKLAKISTSSSGLGTNLKNIRSKVFFDSPLLQTKQIRQEGEIDDQKSNKFVHIPPESMQANSGLYYKAIAFTKALIIDVITEQHVNLKEYYDFEKPKIISQQIDSDGHLDLGIQLKPIKSLPFSQSPRDISPDDQNDDEERGEE